MRTFIKDEIEKICSVLSSFQHDAQLLRNVEEISRQCTDVLRRGRKILFAGNGGSAAIASHMAIDFWKNAGIKALAFNDGALLTCVSNDHGYSHVFEKSIEMFAEYNDVLLAFSSSGNSENILRGVVAGQEKQGRIITFSGFKEELYRLEV